MLQNALLFLIVAIVAAVLGFGFLADTAAWIAYVLALVFVVLFVISFITGKRPKL